jgi:hypothetical protein
MASKSPLEQFLERLYRLKVFKFGQLEDRFIILTEPMVISDVVELTKKWCNTNGYRFMGVRPMFEMMKDE